MLRATLFFAAIVPILLALDGAGLLGQEKASTARVAVITDISGETSECQGLHGMGGNELSGKLGVSYMDRSASLFVSSDKLVLAIPFANVISVEFKEGKAKDERQCEVKYLQWGEERSARGNLSWPVAVQGKTDFGNFALRLEKIQRITFKTAPAQVKPTSAPKYDATLLLSDGTKVRVSELKRSFYVSRGDGPASLPTLKFVKGESMLEVRFDDTKSIEFGSGDRVTVTLKTGKAVSGTLRPKPSRFSGSPSDGITGFTGVCDRGPFVIDLEHVKAVEFDPKK
jgi:hypothetical protein